MTEQQDDTTTISHEETLALTSQIVAAHVAHNPVPTQELPGVIRSVHATLTGLGAPAPAPEEKREPAVPIKKSVADDHVVCLECGKKMKLLKRHLANDHGMTPEEYRRRWSLPASHPLVAPAYSRKREELAKKSGLGRKGEDTKAGTKASKPGAKAGRKKAA
jgi:predicted transcriptional regulator